MSTLRGLKGEVEAEQTVEEKFLQKPGVGEGQSSLHNDKALIGKGGEGIVAVGE